ncbi:unnamed protein product [Amoebophrya sp. A25]|nr:unnamed protein product [Amoebophrya sp. A25]|eukprot:GSA25T00026018001.1
MSRQSYFERVRDAIQAARGGDVERLRELLGSEESLKKLGEEWQSTNGMISPNVRDDRWRTLIMYAGSFGRRAAVHYLARHPGIDINIRDDCQMTVLHHACRKTTKVLQDTKHSKHQAVIVRDLIRNGASINAVDSYGVTPFMYAVDAGDRVVICCLLDHEADIFMQDYQGNTAMSYAELRHDFKMGTLLYHAGLDCPDSEFGAELCDYIDEREGDVGSASEGEEYLDSEEEHDDGDLSGLDEINGADEVEENLRQTNASQESQASRKTIMAGDTAKRGKKSVMFKAQEAEYDVVETGVKSKGGKAKHAPSSSRDVEKRPSQAGSAGFAGRASQRASRLSMAGKTHAKRRTTSTPEGIHDDMSRMSIRVDDESNKESLLLELLSAIDTADVQRMEVALLHAKANEEFDLTAEDAYEKCEAALQVAKKLEAATNDLCDAIDLFKTEKAKAKAEELKPALMKFEAALEKAKKSGVSDSDLLEQGRSIRDEGRTRVDNRGKLAQLANAGKVDEFRTEFQRLKSLPDRGQLIDADVAEFEKKLEVFANKEAAEKALADVLQTKPIDVDALKSAIASVKRLGIDVAIAEKVLKEEEPKKAACDALEAVLSVREDVEDAEKKVKSALDACRKLGMLADERPVLVEAANWLAAEKERAAMRVSLANLLKTTEGFEQVDAEKLDQLREWERQCAAMLTGAKKIGIKEVEMVDLELRKKKVHNRVEDLKGSIRVFVRVRPFNKKEEDAGDHEAVHRVDAQSLSVEDSRADKGSKKMRDFTFDAAHFPGTQEEIFEDTKDLVQSAFDGYNVTVFAYGQTGAGKTHTMTGKAEDPGVVPRSCKEVFRIIDENSDRFIHTVSLHMIELYCANFTDLLLSGKGKKGGPGAVKAPEIKIRREKDGTVTIDGAEEKQLLSATAMENAIASGFGRRAVASTAMNAESSRSHLITVVKLCSVNKETKQKTCGKLLMCDLAGCERIAKSQVTGQGQKEAIEINKSLTALGDVIEALTRAPAGGKNTAAVIPYRNHLLTQLMQDSLGGSAKTLMFMNCSPASSNVDETMNSLKYAERAKKVTNTVTKK